VAFVDLAQAYADFAAANSQTDWDNIRDTYLDDQVVLFNYDIPAGQAGHVIGPGKQLVIDELKRVRADIQQYWPPTSVELPPLDPVGLVPGGAAVDRLKLQQTAGGTPRHVRRIQRGPHSCTDLFKFNTANPGKILEIHYCVADGP